MLNQKLKALQMSLRFEKLMAEQRALESSAALNDQELLYSIIERYNNFRGVAGIKRWQISDDMKKSIEGIVIGITDDSKALLRSHLDFNKWEESGGLEEKTHLFWSHHQIIFFPGWSV